MPTSYNNEMYSTMSCTLNTAGTAGGIILIQEANSMHKNHVIDELGEMTVVHKRLARRMILHHAVLHQVRRQARFLSKFVFDWTYRFNRSIDAAQ